MAVTRRQFIQIGAGAAGVAAASGLTTNWWGLDRNRIHDPGTEGEKIIPTFCELCFWKCGILAHVKDGKVTKLKGNPAHPLSRGRLCPRGVGGTGLLYDPDRLKKPLIRRTAKRGEQIFEEATWAEALDLVANRLGEVRDQYGPEAVALFTHGYGGKWMSHLCKACGTPNIAAPSYAQCRGPREVGYYLTFGSVMGSPEPLDIENSRCLVLIGSHLGENMHNTQVQEMADAIDKGCQLVVVDPRFSTAAGKARYWLPIKPGTDIALLLAWLHVIIKEKRYDADYLAKYADGFEELSKHVEDKTPEWAFPLTGIRPELIRETARFISGFRPATLIHPGRRTTWYGDDTQRARAMAILAAVLGAYGRKGGYLIPSHLEVPEFPYTTKYPANRGLADRPMPSLYPLADEVLAQGVCDASIPGTSGYDIKAWVVYGTNLLQCLPDPRRVREAIEALDFIVSIDVLPAEICGWSDVVLPECTYLERCDELWTPYYKQPFLAVRQPVVEPMYDSKPGWWIAKELAKRAGYDDYFPWADSMAYAKHRVEAAGLDCEALKKTGVVLGERRPVCEEEGLPITFDTPSGKIELYSKRLAGYGFDPLPNFTAPEEPPPGSFRLLFGRSPVHSFGRTTNNRFLSQITAGNEVWLNADVAREVPGVGPVKTGDYLVLVNQDGVRSEPIPAKVTERIRGDCVYMVHGYGHSAKGLAYAHRRGASDSELVTKFKTDPIMGGTGMNVNFVRLERGAAPSGRES